MEDFEMKDISSVILNRLHQSQVNIEKTAFNAINITDRLVKHANDAREGIQKCIAGEVGEDQRFVLEKELKETLDELLETAFLVNNVAHELEQEAEYQQETTQNVMSIVDYLFSIQ